MSSSCKHALEAQLWLCAFLTIAHFRFFTMEGFSSLQLTAWLSAVARQTYAWYRWLECINFGNEAFMLSKNPTWWFIKKILHACKTSWSSSSSYIKSTAGWRPLWFNTCPVLCNKIPFYTHKFHCHRLTKLLPALVAVSLLWKERLFPTIRQIVGLVLLYYQLWL